MSASQDARRGDRVGHLFLGMIQRDELNQFLQETFQPATFQDFCYNGLQIEGKPEITTLAFGVSFHLPLLEQVIARGADALIVHHGLFGKNFWQLNGALKTKISALLHHDISLFGLHLPLDAHPIYGNNAQLAAYLDAEVIAPFDVGVLVRNVRQYSVLQMLDIFHQMLHPAGYQVTDAIYPPNSVLTPKFRHGFCYLPYGPAIPATLAIVSGSSAKLYRTAEFYEKRVDTFIGGSIDEGTPAAAYETSTNFLNIGHYWSEKAGILALQAEIQRRFDVTTLFLEIANVI